MISIKPFSLRYLPGPIAHDLRRIRFRLNSADKFRALQELRRQRGEYGLLPFDERKTIFVHTPKCAGTSFCTSLFGHQTGGHRSISFYQLVYPWITFQRYYKFSIVRNPYDRLVSAFLYMKKGGGNANDAQWVKKHSPVFATFRNFVINGLCKPEISNAMHFKPQVFYLRDFRGKMLLDFIGRYEELGKASAHIFSHLKVASELKWLNRTTESERPAFQTFYDEDTRRIVAQIYTEDLNTFGYDFDS